MKQGNVLALTYWSYRDALIQTATLPYVRMMRKNLSPTSTIYFLTLEKPGSKYSEDETRELKNKLASEGIHWIPFNYYPFGFMAMLQWVRILTHLLRITFLKNIGIIHCWCTPAGAAGYLISVLSGKKLILDSYEPHAESMVEGNIWSKNSFAFRLLFWMEKKQTQRAASIISLTGGMRDYSLEKYAVSIRDFHIRPSCVDLNLFSRNKIKDGELLNRFNYSDKIICVYAGKFGGIYLDKQIFDFLEVAAEHWGDRFRVLILTNHTREEIERYCHNSGLSPDIVESVFVEHDEVPRYMGLGDFALSPVKPIPTKRYCSPIKNGEYWALGLPIVIPKNISDDSEIVETENIGVVLMNLTRDDYRKAVEKIDSLLNSSSQSVKIRSIAREYRSFEVAEKVYDQVYRSYFPNRQL